MPSRGFFITPEEQKRWLSDFFESSTAWLVLSRPRETLQEINRGEVESLDFDGSTSWTLYLGDEKVRSEPKLDKEIDLAHSGAVRFDPCLIFKPDILLQGYLGILDRNDYVLSDVDPGPIFAWYHQLEKKIEKLINASAVLTLGERSWPQIWVSHGTISLVGAGYRLKHLPKNPYDFTIVTTSEFRPNTSEGRTKESTVNAYADEADPGVTARNQIANRIASWMREQSEHGYPVDILKECVCECGGSIFELEADELEGCARRTCSNCKLSRFICDSEEIWADSNPALIKCSRGHSKLKLLVGFSLRDNGDVRMITIGHECVECAEIGGFDWQIDYSPSDQLPNLV